ncbi:MAG: hypothetical protein RhofKO_12800 [Rhodothermales bacterium]
MLARRYTSTADYLAHDLASDGKNEFWDGDILAMAGALPNHNIITINLGGRLQAQLAPRGCRTYSADQRVRLGDLRYVYPDLTALCQPPEYTDESPPSLINPALLVEISSPSTERRDRREKLEAYTDLPSLYVYWIVETDRPMVTCYERQGDMWTVRLVHGLDATAESTALDLAVPLAEIYMLVEWPADDAPEAESEA